MQENGDVTDSYARGIVSADSPGFYVGGLIGAVNGTHITRTYSTGSATGSLAVGGLVGYSVGETYIYDSFTTGIVYGDDVTVNALVGQDFSDMLIMANAYANADNERLCMVGTMNQDRGGCTQISIVENPDMFYYASDEPMTIDAYAVWSFGGQEGPWHEKLNDYPNLNPLDEPEMQCEQAQVTETTAHVACGT